MVVTYHVWLGRVSGGVDIFLLISAFLMTLSFARKVEGGKPLRLAEPLAAPAQAAASRRRRGDPRRPGRHPADPAPEPLAGRAGPGLGLAAVPAELAPGGHRRRLLRAGPRRAPARCSTSGRCPSRARSSCSGRSCSPARPCCCALLRRDRRRDRVSYRAPPGRGLRRDLRGVAGFLHRADRHEPGLRLLRHPHPALGVRPRLAAGARPAATSSPARPLRVVLGWAGLAAMLSCGLLLTVDRSFPGFIALWPTLAAAAIIVAGQSGSRFGVDRFLTWKPLVALGDNSYALYLWHWPLLVLALAATGIDAPEPRPGPGDRRRLDRAGRADHPVRGEAAARMALAAAPRLAHRRRDRGLRRPAGRAGVRVAEQADGGRGRGRGAAEGTDPRRGRPGPRKRRQADAGGQDHPGAGGHEERVGGHRRAVHGRQRPQRPAARRAACRTAARTRSPNASWCSATPTPSSTWPRSARSPAATAGKWSPS